MSRRDPKLLLQDILDSANKILYYTSEHNFETFSKDDKTSDAVIRNFEIIGEASNRLPEDFRNSNSQIDWNKMRGFRNRIIHDYFGVDYAIVWEIKEKYLPQLISEVERLLEK